jgi:hypothetical protein
MRANELIDIDISMNQLTKTNQPTNPTNQPTTIINRQDKEGLEGQVVTLTYVWLLRVACWLHAFDRAHQAINIQFDQPTNQPTNQPNKPTPTNRAENGRLQNAWEDAECVLCLFISALRCMYTEPSNSRDPESRIPTTSSSNQHQQGARRPLPQPPE